MTKIGVIAEIKIPLQIVSNQNLLVFFIGKNVSRAEYSAQENKHTTSVNQ